MKRAYQRVIKLQGLIDSALDTLLCKILNRVENDLDISLDAISINTFSDGGMALMIDGYYTEYEEYNRTPQTGIPINIVINKISASKGNIKLSELIDLRTE